MDELKLKLIDFTKKELRNIVDSENNDLLKNGDFIYAISEIENCKQINNQVILNVKQYNPESDSKYLNILDNDDEDPVSFIENALNEGTTNNEKTIESEYELIFSKNLKINPLIYQLKIDM